jgi:hypothetical protein
MKDELRKAVQKQETLSYEDDFADFMTEKFLAEQKWRFDDFENSEIWRGSIMISTGIFVLLLSTITGIISQPFMFIWATFSSCFFIGLGSYTIFDRHSYPEAIKDHIRNSFRRDLNVEEEEKKQKRNRWKENLR